MKKVRDMRTEWGHGAEGGALGREAEVKPCFQTMCLWRRRAFFPSLLDLPFISGCFSLLELQPQIQRNIRAWKKAQLPSALGPNKNRAGPRPPDSRGRALPSHTRASPLLRKKITLQFGHNSLTWKSWKEFFKHVIFEETLGTLLGAAIIRKEIQQSETETLLTWHGYYTCASFLKVVQMNQILKRSSGSGT